MTGDLGDDGVWELSSGFDLETSETERVFTGLGLNIHN